MTTEDQPHWQPDFIEEERVAKPDGPKRVVAYARHSSPRQRSCDAQIDECRRRCSERGWKLAYILTDEALSGNDGTRPGYWRIIDLAENGQIDIVMVWKLDRMARNIGHAGVMEEELRAQGVSIHSVTEPIDTTTPMGRFIFGNLVNAAALEREMIRERARLGMENAIRKGRWPRKQAPYGYRKTKGGMLRVFRPEAEIVPRVFDAYLLAGSYAECAHLLNEQEEKFRGDRWSAQRVRTILEHTIYDGHYTHSGILVKAPYLKVLDEGKWAEVERARKRSIRNGQPARGGNRTKAIDRIFDAYINHLQETFVDPGHPNPPAK